MFMSSRSRIMIAALVFALAWALGMWIDGVANISLTIICLAIGSIALSYFVWEYHRAWRLRPLSPDAKLSPTIKNWSGVSMNGLIIRPEYITAGLALLICVLGMFKYFQLSSGPSVPIPQSPPSLLLPETRPLQ